MQNLTSLPHMVTISEAADFCKLNKVGISKYHIRQLCKHNLIPHCKTGVKTLLNLDGLLNYLSSPPVQAHTINPAIVRRVPENIHQQGE